MGIKDKERERDRGRERERERERQRERETEREREKERISLFELLFLSVLFLSVTDAFLRDGGGILMVR